MKKLLGIVVLGLLWCNVTQAKPIDVGNGITLDIPKNYKYFEINYKKLESLLVTFPDLNKQIKSKNYKETLKLIGIGNNSKLMVLVENQKTLELIKKISTPSGIKDIIKEFEDIAGPLLDEYMEENISENDKSALSKMSEKKLTKWLEKWYAEPAQVKFMEQLAAKSLKNLFEKYKLDKYVLIMTMDKKMDNDLFNELQTLDNKVNIKKEISNFFDKSPMYKDYSTEFNKLEVGKNSNNDLFLYTQAIMKHDKWDSFNSEGEVFFSSINEKIIFAGTTCFKNCDDLSKIIYETFEPTGLLAKKNEKKKTKTNDKKDILQQLKDLEAIYKSGALTKEEFTKAKKKLLN